MLILPTMCLPLRYQTTKLHVFIFKQILDFWHQFVSILKLFWLRVNTIWNLQSFKATLLRNYTLRSNTFNNKLLQQFVSGRKLTVKNILKKI